MASSSGNSCTSLSDEDLKVRMEQRKRRRMDSNRESARRSRVRKRKQLEDLASEVDQLKNGHKTALATLTKVNQNYMAIEAENCVLRTQVMELNNRLHALNEIMNYMNLTNNNNNHPIIGYDTIVPELGFDVNIWNQHPLMASSDLFPCF